MLGLLELVDLGTGRAVTQASGLLVEGPGRRLLPRELEVGLPQLVPCQPQEVEADDAAKARAAKAALIASRTNVLLSVPMLLAMTAFR